MLSNLFIDVSNEQVCVLIILWLGRGIDDADSLSIDLGIVHFFEATLSFFFLNELKVSISAGLVSLRIDDNLGILDLESSGGEELIEVKIEEALLRKTAYIETRKFVHSCLALLLVLNVSTLSVRSMSNVHVVELLSEEILGVGHLLLLLSTLREIGLRVNSHGRTHLLHHHGWHSHRVDWLLDRHAHHHGVTKGHLAWHIRKHFAIKLAFGRGWVI